MSRCLHFYRLFLCSSLEDNGIMVCPALLLQSFIWISLMAKGVQYDVTHIVSKMCVVRQSMVLIPCKHTSPNEQVSSAEWLFERSLGQRVRVSQDPAFVGRVECVQPAAGNCSLLLKDVRKSDAGIFRFVLNTTSGQTWTNNQGIQLEVTDANLEVKTESDAVMEGDLIMFVCGSCIPSMTVPTYIWRKDGQLHSQHHGENILVLESVELKDGGRYSCTISGHEGLNSTSDEITVRPGYPPKSVLVSIGSTGEIVEGDLVTLHCNSDAKPPAEISWFKKGKAIGSGRIYSISNISSDHSGEYKCRSRNKYGEKDSDNVMLNVKYAPRDVVVTINGSGEIVEGDSVTLICSSDSNPPALNFSWFKENQSSAVGSGQRFIISSFNSRHSGRYYCEAQNQHGSQRSASVSVKESSSSLIMFTMGISAAVVLTSVILMVFIGDLIRRKRATQSEEQKPGGSGHNKTLESSEDAYMSLEPKSRCSEYDTLDNMKRSCENTDHPEDPIYDNF
ncbi:B-cell receptor CD22-like [Carassius carassius]|uniref:B-cell receptor CD22-like n=1 Tax=Carassius carassius TaxID=217509 RepID=UPI00286889B0|nr:B-cell receptor CD22-like [Carassius carassius]